MWKIDHISSNLLKAVFYKIYLVHSWIFFLTCFPCFEAVDFFWKFYVSVTRKMQCSFREELLCSELSENQVFLVSNLTPSLLHFSGKNTNQFQNLYLPYLEQLVNTTCKDFVCEDVTFYCNTLFPVASCKWLWHWCPPLWCKTSVSPSIICESNSSKI